MENSNEDFKVLVLEDDDDVRETVIDFLKHEFHFQHITGVANGKDGLEVLKKAPIDLVISDIMMPEMDGIEFLKQTREQNLDALVIMLTGNANLDYAIKCLRYGAFDFIEKPVKHSFIEGVQAAIDHLKKRRLGQIKIANKDGKTFADLVLENEKLLKSIRTGLFIKTSLSCLYRNLYHMLEITSKTSACSQNYLDMVHNLRVDPSNLVDSQIQKLETMNKELIEALGLHTA